MLLDHIVLQGFYAVYAALFARIAEDESEEAPDDQADAAYPPFGAQQYDQQNLIIRCICHMDFN